MFPLNGSAEEVDSRGVYNLTEGTIEPEGCDFTPNYRFELDGQQLTFRFTCFEGCALRLRKLRKGSHFPLSKF